MINEYTELIKRIESSKRLYIYGAGIVGYGVFKAVQTMFNREVVSFIVSDIKYNPTEYAGTPVISFLNYIKIHETEDLILVATPPEYHNEIVQMLVNNNMKEYLLITPGLEYCLMGQYLKQHFNITCIEDVICSNNTIPTGCKVFMAVSNYDKELINHYTEENYVTKIQVGKECTELLHNDAEIYDNEGDNISVRNPLYGELTATYNVWKNHSHDIMGIFHYRRVMDVKTEQLSVFNNNIDVILPLPFVCYPDASGQYGRYLSGEDVDIMKEVLYEYHPELKELIIKALNSQILYNYNMLIAKREVFNDYCEWIFPLLEEITNRCESHNRERLSRYVGRIGEILTSLYFTINTRNWNVAHAPKIWRV